MTTTDRARGARRAFELHEPAAPSSPLVFASPHAGRCYPRDLMQATDLRPEMLRRSEDAYVDLLIADAARAANVPFLNALFPRTYVDVNRDARELDPAMFCDPLPADVDARSARVAAGLGAIPRIVADGHEIYGAPLRYADARRRLQTCYAPYHDALQRLIDRTAARFGCAVLIDWHSMPSAGLSDHVRGPAPDIVLGDRFGASAAGPVAATVERLLAASGFFVVRNTPYAGGYVAAAYGRPAAGRHVVQIEINRRLYLDEARVELAAGFEPVRRAIAGFVSSLGAALADAPLAPRLSAAE